MHSLCSRLRKPLVVVAAAALWSLSLTPSAHASGPEPLPGLRNYRNDIAKPNQKIEIFVTAWCPYCQRLEKFLKANNVSYKRFDIEKDGADATRRYRELGGGGVPIIKIGTQIIRGFDEAHIRTALGIK